jgi:hypothetical protein
VGHFARLMRDFDKIDDIANSLWSSIIAGNLSEDFQWKVGGRVNDQRPGLMRFINVLAVIGGNNRWFFSIN